VHNATSAEEQNGQNGGQERASGGPGEDRVNL
jgi:hypothetical protein